MTFERISFEVDDAVAIITLRRPAEANAMDLGVMQELARATARCDEDPDIRAVVLTGTGRFFSAGGDLAAMAAAEEGVSALLEQMTSYLHEAVARIGRMEPPVIAAVNGTAAGAGMSLALACDLVLAAEGARFTAAYTAAGLTPDGSATHGLPRMVGPKRAAELLLTNRWLSAEDAHSWGIVNRVVPDERLHAEAVVLARDLASGPTMAFGGVKRLLADTFMVTLEQQMEREAEMIARMSDTADGREGVAAFLEKRDPRFGGR